MGKSLGVRTSPIAGRWYPADAQHLAAQVDRYMAEARLPAIEGNVIGVMAPHAGYQYSGPVAAYAFATLRGLQPELAVVISPMHYPYAAPLLTTAHSAYATPLGDIPVDVAALSALDEILRGVLGHGMTRIANDEEHSLEIELPFLQRVLAGDFKLLPVMVRDPSRRTAQALGEALASILSGRRSILVASTDLSHFYPQRVAKVLDDEVLKAVANFNPGGVLEVEEQGRGFACGRGALAAVMWAAHALGADQARLLHYATSADVTGDTSSVVGYGAAVFTKNTEE